jgi:hypothetical protein
MNDLERDLKDLMHEKADGLDVASRAPEPVLRRGRRRQVRTAISGGLAAAALAAVAFAGVQLLRAPDEPAPATPISVLGERTASLGVFTVTAPEGWSLIDWWPVSVAIPAEECFASVGSGTDTVTSSDGCRPAHLPGGVPVVQLTNDDPGLITTACGFGRGDATSFLAGSRAVLYVGMSPTDGVANGTAALQGVRLDPAAAPTDGPCGAGWYARFAAGGRGYRAFVGFGPDASQADREATFAAFDAMRAADVEPTEPLTYGPGYVIAAGTEGDKAWRVEATITVNALNPQGGDPHVIASAITTIANRDVEATEVAPPSGAQALENAHFGEEMAIGTFGTAAANVTAVQLTDGDMTVHDAQLVPWPDTLRGLAATGTPLDGSLWAVPAVSARSDLRVELADGTVVKVPVNNMSHSPAFPPGVIPESEGTRLASGFDSTGIGWSFGYKIDPDLALCDAQGSAHGCLSWTGGPGRRPPVGTPSVAGGYGSDGAELLGLVPLDVARVVAVRDDGERTATSALYDVPSEFGPLRAFIMFPGPQPPSHDGLQRYSLLFLDDAGHEIYPAQEL